MMMVRAGSAVDELMEQLFPLLSPGDILIDGGNSNYEDTQPPRGVGPKRKDSVLWAQACPAVKRAR